MDLREVARSYYIAGLNVLPADRKAKRPIGRWKEYAKKRPSFEEVFPEGLTGYDALAVICGATSGGLEVLDFDQQGVMYTPWAAIVGDARNLCVGEKTQNGGAHLAFRSDACERNQKLASNASGVTIETRGEGGLVIVAPSPGYQIRFNSWTNVRKISPETRAFLLSAARSLDETPAPVKSAPTVRAAQASEPRRSEEYHGESVADLLRRDDVAKTALTNAGWKFIDDEPDWERWERPGQPVPGKSGASYSKRDKFFHVFTSNAPPFEPGRSYSPLQVVALLEFGGDESACSREYARRYNLTPRRLTDCQDPTRFYNWRPDAGNSPAPEPAPEPGLSPEVVDSADPTLVDKQDGMDCAEPSELELAGKNLVPPFPDRLLNCGGFIQEFVDLTLQYSVRPQPEGAFLGALTVMSYLCGRSIIANYNGATVTPNLYSLFLAPTGMGKEAIRRTCSEVARAYDEDNVAPESFASVQALQNFMARVNKTLWLHDEFGRDLAVMSGKMSNANITGLITECLKLYTSANSRWYKSKLIAQEAKNRTANTIDRPFLSIFATGNPSEFFDAASDSLLTNGYIARFSIVLAPWYVKKREVDYKTAVSVPIFSLPDSITEQAAAWREYEAVMTNGAEHIPFTEDAHDVLKVFDSENEKRLANALGQGEAVAEIRTRFGEKIWKYALLFAASRYCASSDLQIDVACAENAVAFAEYEATLLEAIAGKFGSNEVDKMARKIMEWGRRKGGSFTRADFTRKFFRGDRKIREDALQTLLDGAWLDSDSYGSSGRSGTRYRVVS